MHPFGVLYFPPAPASAPASGFPGANRLSLVPVRDVMCETVVEWINTDNTCAEAAKKMLEVHMTQFLFCLLG